VRIVSGALVKLLGATDGKVQEKTQPIIEPLGISPEALRLLTQKAILQRVSMKWSKVMSGG
jgi:hypothetical protein